MIQPAPRPLTRRQREILLLAAAGHTNQQIGHRLRISAQGVNRVLGNAYNALGAHDRAHAVALAIWHGEITLADLAAIAGNNQRQEAAA
ncbi:LuxR C-terminal-related transcriptional regulator [Streptomyces sp. NPDC058464]|uniref:LuxR C-terminal-related transcriptional regulator n=1 Tax=Streptomyces sp. NPDC058464 TaxID=3346511 RepID=UPI00364B36A7